MRTTLTGLMGWFGSSEAGSDLELEIELRFDPSDSPSRTALRGTLTFRANWIEARRDFDAFTGHVDGFARGLQELLERRRGVAVLHDMDPQDILQVSTSPNRYPLCVVGAWWDDVNVGGIALENDEVNPHLPVGSEPENRYLWAVQGMLVQRADVQRLAESLGELLRTPGLVIDADW